MNIGIFIDAQNFMTSAYSIYSRPFIDYAALDHYFGQFGHILTKIIFRTPGTDAAAENRFVQAMANLGFRVISVEDGKVTANGKAKDRTDIILTLEVAKVANALDMVILLSGDGDFVPLVRYLDAAGKIVWVVSFPNVASRDLVRSCHRFIEATQIPGLVGEQAYMDQPTPAAPAEPQNAPSLQQQLLRLPPFITRLANRDLVEAIAEFTAGQPTIQPAHASLLLTLDRLVIKASQSTTAPKQIAHFLDELRAGGQLPKPDSLPGANAMFTLATCLAVLDFPRFGLGLVGSAYYIYPFGKKPERMVEVNLEAAARDTLAMLMMPERADAIVDQLLIMSPDEVAQMTTTFDLVDYKTSEPHHNDRWMPPREFINRIVNAVRIYAAKGLPWDKTAVKEYLHLIRLANLDRWVQVGDVWLRGQIKNLFKPVGLWLPEWDVVLQEELL